MQLASSRRPAMAIQLYSAIHYTAIQRYTVYMLYIIPLHLLRQVEQSEAGEAPHPLDARALHVGAQACNHTCWSLHPCVLESVTLCTHVHVRSPRH